MIVSPRRDQRDEAQPAAAGLLERSGGDQPGPGLQTLGPRSAREDLLDIAAEQRGVVSGASARLLLVPDQRRQLELRTLAERLWGQLLHRNTLPQSRVRHVEYVSYIPASRTGINFFKQMRRRGAPYKVTSPFGVDDASARMDRLVDGAGLAGFGPGRPDGHDCVVDRIDLSRVGARPAAWVVRGQDVGDPAGGGTHHLAGPDRRMPGSRRDAALHRCGAPARRGCLRHRLPRYRPGALAVRMGSPARGGRRSSPPPAGWATCWDFCWRSTGGG